MVGQKLGQRPGHYFVALTIDPSTATASAETQTDGPNSSTSPVETPPGAEPVEGETAHRPPLIYAAVISQKSEAAAAVMQLLAAVREDHGGKPNELVFRLHSDRGQELLPEALEAY